jgi:hypothetical protein
MPGKRRLLNWRVEYCGPTKALAIEPGREHEWVFEGGPTPFDAALAFAAARLRDDPLP